MTELLVGLKHKLDVSHALLAQREQHGYDQTRAGAFGRALVVSESRQSREPFRMVDGVKRHSGSKN